MVYVILVYDVNVSRVNEVRKYLRRYLYWTQNSVFEGELSEIKLEKILYNLKKICNEKEDSIRVYVIRDKFFIKRVINIGIIKGGEPDLMIF